MGKRALGDLDVNRFWSSSLLGFCFGWFGLACFGLKALGSIGPLLFRIPGGAREAKRKPLVPAESFVSARAFAACATGFCWGFHLGLVFGAQDAGLPKLEGSGLGRSVLIQVFWGLLQVWWVFACFCCTLYSQLVLGEGVLAALLASGG